MSALEEYNHALRSTYVSRSEPDIGRTYILVDEDAADAVIVELEAENERLRNAYGPGERQRAEQAEAEIKRWEACAYAERAARKQAEEENAQLMHNIEELRQFIKEGCRCEKE